MLETIKASSVTETNTSKLKVPPNSIESEQSVLGGILLNNRAWDEVADLLTEEDFYRQDHRLIFRTIAALSEEGQPFDVVTLSERLDRNNELDKVGGMAYLGALAKDTPSAANVKAYAELVRDRSILRRLIGVGLDIANSGYSPEGRSSTELVDEAERKVYQIADERDRGRKGIKSFDTLLQKAFKRVDELYHSDSDITGLATGFTEFDRMTSGLQKSDLIIVAGRPSMGKTSFAMNIAEHVAIKDKQPVLVFSMEMSGESLATRMMSSLGRIDQHKVRNGRLDDRDWLRLTSAMGILSEATLHIDESPALSPTEIRARARRLKREQGGLGLIIIDYLQLMQVPGAKENRTNEVSEISRSLKALAKELDVPVIALSQLNRSLEQRPNKRPVMSDLRESGSIEQDADVIVFIYRDEVYNEDTADKGIAEIIIGKQRNGPTGPVRLTFLGQYTRFENYISEQQYPPPGFDPSGAAPAPGGGGFAPTDSGGAGGSGPSAAAPGYRSPQSYLQRFSTGPFV